MDMQWKKNQENNGQLFQDGLTKNLQNFHLQISILN